MHDEHIFKMALFTSIFGIIGMMFFAGEIIPKEIKIKDLNKGMLDEEVTIQGVVEKIDKSPRSKTYFLQVIDETGKTTVVIFENTILEFEKKNLNVQSYIKRRIKVAGKVTEYNGHMELILNDAKSIKMIS